MITRPLLRALRNDLPMAVTLRQMKEQAPEFKTVDGAVRFLCPHCHEMFAAVNPRNNLAHCFNCGANTNNIDLLVAVGYRFTEAVAVLTGWLDEHNRRRAAQLRMLAAPPTALHPPQTPPEGPTPTACLTTPRPPQKPRDGPSAVGAILRQEFARAGPGQGDPP
jgi:hypothetical protein